MFGILIGIMFFIVLIFLFLHQKWMIEPFNFLDYNKLLESTNKLLRPSFASNIKPEEEDCFEMCDSRECIQMQERNKILNSCLKCHEENKCFRKSIIGGNCDDCMENEIPINCYDTRNFGCTNPRDLNSFNGVHSYFIMSNDDDVNSLYNKECLFCWNILDNL